MYYVVDANNLAGKLEILFEDDFDKKLIKIIKNWSKKKNNIYLVFDSADLMGDKYSDENIIVIYTPRDLYYKSADDKVIEIAKNLLKNQKEEIRVVTDDLEIIKKLEKNVNHKFKMIKATEFAKKINRNVNSTTQKKQKLDYKAVCDINDELLKIWK